MRGSRLSCVLCTLLSLFMVMPASVASAATEGSGGSGEVTIHYYDSAGWAKPFAYMYGDGVRSASWPGERMADDGDGWYSVTVNAPHGLRVLFSDNGKSQHPGTNQPGYEVNGEAWFVGSTRYDSMPEGVKVHFYDYANWGKVRLYYYSEAARGPTWPGEAMHADGDGWYTATIFGTQSTRVLFNDGGSRQTPASGQEGHLVTAEAWCRNGVWTDTRPDGVLVMFHKPSGWGSPRIYYYASDADTGPAWPGTAMKHMSDDWYSYTITKYAKARVLFNDGGHQVPAKSAPGYEASGVCRWDGGDWSCGDPTSDGDNDGVPDVLDMMLGGDNDTDGDGLPDAFETIRTGTDPSCADGDGDGVADGDEDPDGDGLTNLTEREIGTDPLAADTDGDGLTDGEETTRTHTDPLKSDTDGDGVDDRREIQWGTDPLVPQETFDVTAPAEDAGQGDVDVSVSVNLPASQAATLDVRKYDNPSYFPDDMPGLIGDAYEFTVDGQVGAATLRFRFDESLLSDSSFDPAICWFNEKEQRLEELDTTVTGNEATATVSHFSKYVLVNRTTFHDSFSWEDVWSDEQFNAVQTVFVIDDSGSMWSNDRGKKRLSVARDLVERFPENTRTGVVRFADGVTDLTGGLTDAQTAKNALADANFYDSGGTSMYLAVRQALNMFQGDDDTTLRNIIVLSDGETSDTRLHDSVVAEANKRKVKINAVGLGGGGPGSYFERWMKVLASQTGGESYLAQNADALAGIYEDIGKLIDIETDSDGDGIADWYEDHLVLFNGVSLKLDKNNPDTDGDGIPDGEEIDRLDYRYNADRTKVIVTGRLITNPALVDSDGDGIADADESDSMTDPMNPDTDGDGLTDGDEVRRNFDPTSPDPDGDGRRDDRELSDDTSPYVYDKAWYEQFACFVVGALAGDFITDDDDPVTLAGQIIGGVIPASDIRDVIANVKHGDYAFAAISAVGIVPAAGDAAKGAAKAGRFILRNIDDPAKAARLLAILEENCPSVVAKLGGSDGFVKAAASFAQTGHARLTKKEKQHLVKAVKKAGLAKHLVTSGRDLPIAATIDTGKNVWNERWLKRGDIIDECLNGHSAGRGLGRTFPVADRLENRVLVSTKSLDLDARSYQTPGRLRSRLNKYVKDLEGFEDKYLNKVDSEGHRYRKIGNRDKRLSEKDYDSKMLEVVFPDTAIGNDIAGALRAFQREHAGTGIRIVYKIAK